MYCPNCGAQNKQKQNFCRYCGLLLQGIEKTFLDQLVFGAETERLKSLRNVRKITDYTQFFSVVTLIIAIIVLVFSDSAMGKILVTAGLLSFFLGQAIREIFGYLNRRDSEKYNRREIVNNVNRQREFETKETSKLIEEKPFTPITDMNENSTELLFADRKSKISE